MCNNINTKISCVLLISLSSALAFSTGMSDAQCAKQVDKVIAEFDKAIAANLSVEGAIIPYGTITSPITEKYNPCENDTGFDPAVVTTVYGYAWTSSPQWGWKAAEKFEFLTKKNGKYIKNGDVVILETQTGFENIKCGSDEGTDRVYYSNWLQWVTGDAVALSQCSTLGKEIDWETSWCTLLHCNDTYCTFPSHIDTARDIATGAGITCAD